MICKIAKSGVRSKMRGADTLQATVRLASQGETLQGKT